MNTRRRNHEEAPRALIHLSDPGAGLGPLQSKRMRDFNKLLARFEQAVEYESSEMFCTSDEREKAQAASYRARQELRRFVRLIK